MDSLVSVFNWFEGFKGNELTILSILVSAFGVLLSVLVAGLGIWFAIAQWRLKQSVKISSFCDWTSEWLYQDTYVRSVTLTNEKDKAEAIYAIHLKFGTNTFLTLAETHDDPIILQPFETKKIEMEPVSNYTDGCHHIDIEGEMSRDDLRIVLSTSKGKYITKKGIGIWSPFYERAYKPKTTLLKSERELIQGNLNKIVIPRSTRFIVQYQQLSNVELGFYIDQSERFSFTKGSILVDRARFHNASEFERYLRAYPELEEKYFINRNSISVIDFTKRRPREQRNWFTQRRKHHPRYGVLALCGAKLTYVFNKWILPFNHISDPHWISYRENLVLRLYIAASVFVLIWVVWNRVL